MRTILIIDDDERLRDLLQEYLSARGYAIVTAETAEAGILRLRRGEIDLVVLDLMLPGKDGLTACREIRGFSAVPVIMLTARGDELDRIVGLEVGADDYLAKPFNPRELVARIGAILRRSEPRAEDPDRLEASGVTVSLSRREVTQNGRSIELTTTEFELLRTLVQNAGRVIARERFMTLARGEDWAAYERSVDVHISHLRRKLGDDPKNPTLIKTVRGIGYIMPKDESA